MHLIGRAVCTNTIIISWIMSMLLPTTTRVQFTLLTSPSPPIFPSFLPISLSHSCVILAWSSPLPSPINLPLLHSLLAATFIWHLSLIIGLLQLELLLEIINLSATNQPICYWYALFFTHSHSHSYTYTHLTCMTMREPHSPSWMMMMTWVHCFNISPFPITFLANDCWCIYHGDVLA